MSFDKSEVSDSPRKGLVPILRAGNISDRVNTKTELIWVPQARVRSDQQLRLGDIAICMSSGSQSVVGKSAPLQYEWTGSVGAFCAIVRPNAELVEPAYLSFYMRSESFRSWTRQSEGANIKNIRHSELLRHRLPLPPMGEQRRIGDLLSRAENIVRMRREAEAKSKEIVPALFVEKFGDPQINPRGWDYQKLDDVAVVGSGSGFPERFQGRQEGLLPFYKVSDMNTPGNETYMGRANNYIESADRAELRAQVFPSGTIIFPKIGAAIATNKKRILSMESCIDNNVMGVIPGVRLSPDYLYGLLWHKDISDFASDSQPPSIRKSALEQWLVPIPPVEDQRHFGGLCKSSRQLELLNANASRRAVLAFESLLARLFGEWQGR